MKRFFAMMLTLVCVVFAWGCVGEPTTGESDESTEVEEDVSVGEPDSEATFFPPKCAPDSCGFICGGTVGHRWCVCLDSSCNE